MTRTELLNKYKDYHVNLDNIEEVDFVWKGEKYSDLTGKKKYYDWIIASHVVEHIPDLISFFKGCDAILKDDGVISLAVPDKRYCFDHYRPITGISKIIDNYYQNIRIHTPGTAAEFYLNVVSKAGNTVFYPTEACEFFVTLSRQGKGPGIPRLEMLQLIESELCEGVSAPPKPVTPAPKRRYLFRRLFRRLC